MNIPELHYPRVKRIAPPKLKIPKTSKNRECVFHGLYTSIYSGTKSSVIKAQSLDAHVLITEKTEREKQQPISAGRGGVYYGKTSSMGRIAESGVKQTRRKNDK